MKDREILERLVEKADRYLVALLREALTIGSSPTVTSKARTELFDALEDADKKTDVFK